MKKTNSRKKLSIIILSVILVLTSSLFFAACKKRPKVTFEGWKDEITETVILGESYTVPFTEIKGSDGVIYTYDISVKTKKGEEVSFIAGEFDVEEYCGYVITLSIKVNGKTKSRKIILNVTDVTAPDISFGIIKAAKVGEEYVLPVINVTDDSGEKIVKDVKVFFNNAEITVKENKFTPEKEGVYTIKVTAVDTSGNTATAERSVETRKFPGGGVFENFDGGMGISSSVNGSKAEILDDLEGADGVLKIPGTMADKTEYRFRLPFDKSDYKYGNIDKITLKLYIIRRDENGEIMYNQNGTYRGADVYDCDINSDKSDAYWSGLSGGTWVYYSVENFEGKEDFLTAATGKNGVRLFWTWTRNIELYVDEITYHAIPDKAISVSSDMVNSGEEVTFALKDENITAEFSVTDPDGNAVAAENGKFTANVRGDYIVTATVSEPWYLEGEIKFTVTCTDKYVLAEVPKFSEVGEEIVLPTGRYVDPFSDTVTDAEISVTVKKGEETVPLKDGAFTPKTKGIYKISYTAVSKSNPSDKKTTVYEMVAGTEKLVGNEIENFDSPVSQSVCANERTEWLAEYNGRFGVLKITQNDTYGFYFKTRLSKEKLNSVDWDVVEITFCSDGKRWICYNDVPLHIQSDSEWMTISLPKAEFATLIDKWSAGTPVQLFWAWDKGDVFIDEIKFAKYSEEEVAIPNDKTKVSNGVSFDKNGSTYETETPLKEMPATIEAWIYVPAGTNEYSVIFGNYMGRNKNPYMVAAINANGAPYIRVCDGKGHAQDALFDKVDVRGDKFVHVAFVLDKEQRRALLYVNGGLKQVVTGFTLYSVAPDDVFVIGGDLRSGNHLCFLGKIAGISFFNDVRTQSEIIADIEGVDNSESLIASYDLNGAADKTKVFDLAENIDMLVRETWLDDIEHSDFDYSFAVVGDTQYLIEKNPQHMKDIYEWITANKTEKNIKFVFGLGDITEFLYEAQNTATDNREKQWGVAKDAISRLDGVIPYTLARGNHDDSRLFNSTFGNGAYRQNLTGTRNKNIEDNYRIFYVGDTKYMAVTLDFNPSSETLEWAGNVIANNPDCRVIITTHSHLDYNKEFTQDGGQRIWNELASKYKNVVLVLSGHEQHDFILTRKDKGINGNTVTSVLIDPQDVDLNGPAGLVAMFYFKNNGKDISVEYYSTVRNKYFKERNQISITIDDSMVETPSSIDRRPTVFVGDMPLGTVGEEYTLPTVKAYSASGDPITPSMKLVFNGTEITLDGNAFVPNERGEYLLTITAEDKDGNKRTIEKAIKARTPVKNGLLEDFDDEYSACNAMAEDVEWLETFEGRTGVLHIKANSAERSYYSLRLIDRMSKYPVQPFDSITMKVYVSTASGGSGSFYDTATEKYTGISNKKWSEFTITRFMDWNFFVNNAATDRGAILFNVWTMNIDIYIDEISFDASVKPEIGTDKDEYIKGETVNVSLNPNYDGEIVTAVTVKKPDGSTFALTGNNFVADQEGKYEIVYNVTCVGYERYNGSDTVTITVRYNYFEFGEYKKTVAIGEEVTVPSARFINIFTGEEFKEAEISYKVYHKGKEIAVTGGKFVADSYGYFDITFTATKDGAVLSTAVASVGATNKTLDFMEENSAQRVKKTGGVEFIKEYEGAKGVVKATFDNTTYTHLFFDFGISAEQAAAIDRDMVELRMFVKGNSGTGKFETYYAAYWREWYELNKWVTVKLKKADLTDEYLTENVLSGTEQLLELQNATVTEVYFDYLDVKKYGHSPDGVNRLLGFDYELDVSRLTRIGENTKPVTEWFEEYNDRSGVLKTAASKEWWEGYYFNVDKTVAELNLIEFDYLEIRLLVTGIQSGKPDVKVNYFYNDGTWDQVKLIGTLTPGEWGVAKITRADIDKWDGIEKFIKKLKGEERLFICNGADGDIYIDYIDFVK